MSSRIPPSQGRPSFPKESSKKPQSSELMDSVREIKRYVNKGTFSKIPVLNQRDTSRFYNQHRFTKQNSDETGNLRPFDSLQQGSEI